MIEHGRPKVARDLTDRLNADLDQSDQRLQFVDELNARLRLVLAELVDEPHELQLQAREHLPELVVQLASDSGALFLPRQLQPKREGVGHFHARLDRLSRAAPAGVPQAPASSTLCSVVRITEEAMMTRKYSAVTATPPSKVYMFVLLSDEKPTNIRELAHKDARSTKSRPYDT